MPQVLVPIIQAIGTALAGAGAVTIGTAIVAYASVIATGVVLLGSLALSSSQRRKAERNARAQFDASQVDRLANISTTIAQRELALGRARKGGHVFFRASVGPYKGTFVMCIALAAHEIDGIEQVYLADQPVTLDPDGNVLNAPYGRTRRESATQQLTTATTALTHTPLLPSSSGPGFDLSRPEAPAVVRKNEHFGLTEGVAYQLSGNILTIPDFDPAWVYTVSYQYEVFSSVANIRWYLGAPGQQADQHLQDILPGVWTSAHRVDGIAYAICQFEYDEAAFPSGIPAVNFLLRGAKLYDPRTGATIFSETPALMMRHVLLHPHFGKRTAISAAEDARIIAAANACEIPISYWGTDLVTTFRAALVVPFGAPARDVLDDLSQAMAGQWAYASGEIFVRAGIWQAPVHALHDTDLAVVQRSTGGGEEQQPITLSPHRARNDQFNTVVARIWDAAAAYVMSPITPFRPAALVAADGAELLQEVTMPAVFYAGQAYHIAGIMLRDGRDPFTITLPFNMTAYAVEMFDFVTLTLPRYGLAFKEFQVLGRTLMTEGFIQFTLKESTAAIYQYGGGFSPQGLADNTGLPNPWDIAPPKIATITSGDQDLIVQQDGTVINGVRVRWSAIQDVSILRGGTIEVQYLVVTGGGQWRSVMVPGDATEAIFIGIADRAVISVRARTRNGVATSIWSVQLSHVVIGKSAPPPPIQNLSIAGSLLSWSIPVRVPDLAGFVFRFHYGNNFDWNSAAPLHAGILTDSPYNLMTRPGGTVTIMGKAIDTSGNVSSTTANIVMNLGDPPIANVIEQWDLDAMGWPYAPGEQSGWTIVSGKPSADATDSFYGTDDQSFYSEDTESFYKPSAYTQMVYVTSEISIRSALAGSIMTLATDADGDDLRIEYRRSGPGSFYDADNASFYGEDDEPFYGPPGSWQPWPGQAVAANDAYQFRVTIGAGPTRGVLNELILTVDAPDIEESLADVLLVDTGTVIPYTKTFASIKTVQATLQANGSGAETVEVDKSDPLAPVLRAFNSAHVAVSGASADIVIQGY